MGKCKKKMQVKKNKDAKKRRILFRFYVDVAMNFIRLLRKFNEAEKLEEKNVL